MLLESLLDIYTISKISDKKKYKSSIADFESRLDEGSLSEKQINEVAEIAISHENPWVRSACLKKLVKLSEHQNLVTQVIKLLIHDYEDIVFLPAIDFAGKNKITSSLIDLKYLTNFQIENKSRQVGIPAALTTRSLKEITGASTQVELNNYLEKQGFDIKKILTNVEIFKKTNKQLPEFRLSYICDEETQKQKAKHHTHENMVYIPAGTVSIGIGNKYFNNKFFNWDMKHNHQERKVEVGGFWIDKYPVTNKEYDFFSIEEQAKHHHYCHPHEREGTLHIRNTFFNENFLDSYPVTGVSWFDAYAYANRFGKRLPFEEEWQRAAQGDDERTFPWGNTFNDNQAFTIGSTISSTSEWLQLLCKIYDNNTPVMTSIHENRNLSPFGIVGLSGNNWEWTLSNTHSMHMCSPILCDRSPIELLINKTNFAIIKGGCWNSLPEMTSCYFRGNDFIFDRHFEIGFRCVCDCPPE